MSYTADILATTGLVSFWQLQETSGVGATDSKGTNDATYFSGVTINQTGPGGYKSVKFDGTSGYVSAPQTASLNFTSSHSVEAWVKLTSAPRSASNTKIIHKGYTANSNPFDDYVLGAEGTNGAFYFGVSVGSSPFYVYSTVIPTAGLWYHVVGLYNGSNISVYVNGVFQASVAVTGTIRNDAQPFMIGARSRGGLLGEYFPGNITLVAVYNVALPSATILAHYQGFDPPPARVTQAGVLVPYTADPAARVTQEGVLVPYVTNAPARLSQEGILAIQSGTPIARLSHEGILVIQSCTPTARVTSEGVLVVYSPGLAPIRMTNEGMLVVYAQGQALARMTNEGMLVVYTTAVTVMNSSSLLMGM